MTADELVEAAEDTESDPVHAQCDIQTGIRSRQDGHLKELSLVMVQARLGSPCHSEKTAKGLVPPACKVRITSSELAGPANPYMTGVDSRPWAGPAAAHEHRRRGSGSDLTLRIATFRPQLGPCHIYT